MGASLECMKTCQDRYIDAGLKRPKLNANDNGDPEVVRWQFLDGPSRPRLKDDKRSKLFLQNDDGLLFTMSAATRPPCRRRGCCWNASLPFYAFFYTHPLLLDYSFLSTVAPGPEKLFFWLLWHTSVLILSIRVPGHGNDGTSFFSPPHPTMHKDKKVGKGMDPDASSNICYGARVTGNHQLTF
jgi:hypothetical protein